MPATVISGDQRKRVAIGVLAAALAAPVGFAIAQEAGGDDDAGFVAAEDCPADVIAAADEAGTVPETYAGSCPTAKEAAERATVVNHMRRNGLTKILGGMRKAGASADEIARAEGQLEALGGSYEYPDGEPPE